MMYAGSAAPASILSVSLTGHGGHVRIRLHGTSMAVVRHRSEDEKKQRQNNRRSNAVTPILQRLLVSRPFVGGIK